MTVDPETVRAMRAQAEELANRLRQMTGSMSTLQERLADIRVTAVSRDGLVRVTVGSDGKPRELSLDARIYREPDSQRLAETILDTIEVAGEEARRRVMEICRPFASEEALQQYADGDLTGAMERFRRQMPFMGE
ncbi:YbaB/EbfC family nucleoid-associated protein [Micromonospora sp. HM5-17]|jgi:DNA-binding protein YbaB|uniref:YbaB/EbfC family nucleoid-associated protein n=1 Tax=Micromonospora sp. HM5-17 TaxID=2487710 RepID=UPI000F471A5F|nr:YbaB/EbfC family nucleoid-associated protein [Micromonospora sp. HM5-17]ROT33092.1 YbaB/EbfC family DNA-binding protein [Micromonospora sp. HM5-17]